MFKKTIAMTGAAALLALGLTGCGATLGGGAQSEEAAASADNQLCVIPRTPTPQLLEAVSAGLKTAAWAGTPSFWRLSRVRGVEDCGL